MTDSAAGRDRFDLLAHDAESTVAAGDSDVRTSPFGWPDFRVSSEGPVLLRPSHRAVESRASHLRLTIAQEVWEDAEVRVLSGVDRGVLGWRVIDHSDTLEVLDIPLNAMECARVQREGIVLEVVSAAPIRFFDARGETPDAFRPHVVSPADEPESPRTATLQKMRGLGSLQQFGWKEGCVLDGMLALERRWPAAGYAEAIRSHLSLFVTPRGELSYLDPWGHEVRGFLHGIEGALPFAVIAATDPGHPLVDEFERYVQTNRRADGLVIDDEMVSAEGSYTIAYPLAVVGRVRGRDDLVEMALQQLELRRTRLRVGDALYLRDEPTGRTFKNWCRAYAWHLLGVAKTLGEIQRSRWPDALVAEFAETARRVLSMQLPSGEWRAFLDDPSTGPDTSGSAGIAAALALGAQLGLATPAALSGARRALAGLERSVTFDGLLAGSTQANKDGERLQRREYRVNSQMGTGLLSQLYAALPVE